MTADLTVSETGIGRARFGGIGLWTALLAGALLWLVQFQGVVLGGKNFMGYHLLDPRITGAEASPGKRRLNIELPGRDASLQVVHLPYQSFLARNFGEGRFPLWNPEIGCGQPVTSDPQYKPFNPFFWLYFAHPTAWTFSLGISLMALFGIWGAILFLREAGLGWPAATVGGIVMAFNPLTQQTLVLSSAWTCWAFFWGAYGLERWRKGLRGGLVLVAASAGLIVYAGHPVVGALYAAILLAYGLTAGRAPGWKARALSLGALGAGVAVLGAVHVLPFFAGLGQYAHYKAAWDGGPYNDWWSLADPKSLIYVPMPLWGLALAGIGLGAKRLKALFLGLLAYGVLTMFAWVGPGPLRWVLSLGGILVARYGQEAFWLGLAGLSALGVEALGGSWKPGARWGPSRYFLYGVCSYLALAWIVMEMRFTFFWPGVYKVLAALEWLACLPAVLVLLMPRRRTWTLAASSAFLFAAWLPAALPTALGRYLTRLDWTVAPPGIVREIADRTPEANRVRISGLRYPNDYLADLCPNQNLFWGLADIRLTGPILLEGYAEFTQHWNTGSAHPTTHYLQRQDAQLLRFLGVRWLASDSSRPLAGLPVTVWVPPLVLQEVQDALPWARPVREWETAGGRGDALRRTFSLLRSGRWEGRVVVEGEPAPLGAAGGPQVSSEVRWREHGPNRYRWEVDGAAPSLFVILQNAHPGWRASLDGRPATLLRAYGTFMALPLEAGRREVQIEFKDPWFFAGLAVSACGWLSLVLWALLARAGSKRQGAGRTGDLGAG